MEETTVLRFRIPDADSKGFLRRSLKALEFQELYSGGMTATVLKEMISFLSEYIVEPEEPEAKATALMDASENQINSLLEALSGGPMSNPTESATQKKTASGTSLKGSRPRRRRTGS